MPSPYCLREKGLYRDGVELPRGAKCPRERPAPLGQTQAP